MSAGYRSDRVHVLAEPRRRRPGLRLPGPTGQVRAGQRRCLRRRPGAGHRQVELPAQRAQRLHLRDHRRGTRLRRRRRACCACSACSPTPGCGSRAARPIRSCGCSPPPPRMWVLGQVVHQRRLRHRAAAGHRAAAAADLRGWNINGDNASDHRRDGQRGAARTRGGGRAARRPRRPDEPAAAAAAARAVLPTRTEALRDRLRTRPQRSAAPEGRPAQSPPQGQHGANRHRGRPAGATLRASWRRPARVSSGWTAPARADGLAHWKVSVTGERSGRANDG